MKTHRFFIKESLKNGIARLDDKDLLNQLRNVLRLKAGDKIVLFDGNGGEAEAEVLNFGKDFTEVRILNISRSDTEPPRKVILYCSVLKRENFELVVQKATEIGVAEITPVIAERTEKLGLRIDRLEKIAKEATEQSGRVIVPKIYGPMRLEEALDHAKQNDGNFIFDKRSENIKKLFPERSRRATFRHHSHAPSTSSGNNGYVFRVGIFIGPEGGWTKNELELAEKAGFKKVSLGKLTLRAETAAIVATYVVANL